MAIAIVCIRNVSMGESVAVMSKGRYTALLMGLYAAPHDVARGAPNAYARSSKDGSGHVEIVMIADECALQEVVLLDLANARCAAARQPTANLIAEPPMITKALCRDPRMGPICDVFALQYIPPGTVCAVEWGSSEDTRDVAACSGPFDTFRWIQMGDNSPAVVHIADKHSATRGVHEQVRAMDALRYPHDWTCVVTTRHVAPTSPMRFLACMGHSTGVFQALQLMATTVAKVRRMDLHRGGVPLGSVKKVENGQVYMQDTRVSKGSLAENECLFAATAASSLLVRSSGETYTLF